MESIARISTPISESWTAWVVLSILVALLVANQRQAGLIKGAWRGLWSNAERTYNDSMDFIQELLLNYCRIATPSLVLYMFFFSDEHFRVTTWLMIVGIWILVDLVHWLMIVIIRFTFGLEKVLRNSWKYYLDTWIAANMVLWVILVLILYFGVNAWTGALTIGVLALLMVALLVKITRLFLRSPLSVLYISAYFLTLEILPVVLIATIVSKIA